MPDDKEIRAFFVSESSRYPSMTAAINGEEQHGFPVGMLNIMEHSKIEYFSSLDKKYKDDPVAVYRSAQENLGVTFIDQWIPTNPLSMGESGYDGGAHSPTTGISYVTVDGIEINEPEDVCEHLERFVFPWLRSAAQNFDIEARVRQIGEDEYNTAHDIGSNIFKTGYASIAFPCLRYFTYGYENYFAAYAMYPDVMERDFSLQAKLAYKNNMAAAIAYERYSLPPLNRLDHDMTDSRGTLVNIKSLEKIWFPYLAECLCPLIKPELKLIWHCDGNLMQMIPYLLDIGIQGFQGFQYEDGMDYIKICKMKSKYGKPLFIWAGSSVTQTLPFGTPDDIRNELKFLVENKGCSSLVLGATSSVVPGVSTENLKAMAQGLSYYKNRR